MQQMPLTLDHARDRGLLGMERAAARADKTYGGWTERALNALRQHVSKMPADAEFIIEDVRVAIESKVPVPDDLRAWGAVTQLALRRLYIERTDKFAPAKSSNASQKPLYRRGRAL